MRVLLEMVQCLLQGATDPDPLFILGYVCRWQDHKDEMLQHLGDLGMSLEAVPIASFVPQPVPPNVASLQTLELYLIRLCPRDDR
jgi:hypothetical protein